MKYLILICTFLSGLIIQAQEQQTITHLRPESIKGIFKVGKKSICISFSERREFDHKNIFILQILGDDKTKQSIIVDQNTYMLDVVSNSKNGLIIFFNQEKEMIELFSLDENAKITGQNQFATDPTDLEHYHDFIRWTYSEKNVLFIVRKYSKHEKPKPNETKQINSGYQLIALSQDARLLGSYFESGKDKPTSEIKTIVPFDDGCVIFVSQNELKKKTFAARLDIFSNTAVNTGTYALSGVDFTYYPTDIIYKNNEIISAGMYFKGLWHNAKTSEGLFFMKINMKGEKIALTNQSWADIKSKIGNVDKKDFMFNGKTDFLVEAIEVTPTGYLILGESYGKSSGVTTAEFILDTEDNSDTRILTVYDFIAIETDANGVITSVRDLKKDNSNIRISGGMAMMRNVELSFILKRYNKFPFQYFKNNEIHYISYKNNKGFYSVMDFKTGAVKSSTPIKLEPVIEEQVDPQAQEMIAGSKTLTKLDKFSQKMDNVDKKLDAAGSKLDYAMTKTDVVFTPNERNMSGIILMDDGRAVYYIIHPETYTVYYVIM